MTLNAAVTQETTNAEESPADLFHAELRIAFADLALVVNAERGDLLDGLRDLLGFKNLRKQVQGTFARRPSNVNLGNPLQQP